MVNTVTMSLGLYDDFRNTERKYLELEKILTEIIPHETCEASYINSIAFSYYTAYKKENFIIDKENVEKIIDILKLSTK